MSENEAAEGGVVFEELSAVRSNVVDRGSGRMEHSVSPPMTWMKQC